MKVTFILGNGFDMQVGLNTGYPDFYDYYTNVKGGSEETAKVKDSINKYIANRHKDDFEGISWSDLEWALGCYTSEVSHDEFMMVRDDLIKHLKIYLSSEYKLFSPTDGQRKELLNDFYFPELRLETKYQNILKNYKSKVGGPHVVNTLTFNYTEVVENIFSVYAKKEEKVVHTNNGYLNFPIHIHSDLKNLILGVNDKTQIACEEMRKNYFRSGIIKPLLDDVLSHENHVKAKGVINSTDLFVVFGASLGRTDDMWARAIGDRMNKSNAKLVYFAHDTDVKNLQIQHLPGRIYDDIATLIGQFRLDVEKFDPITTDRIIVRYNKDLFKVKGSSK